ncbi:MAG: hypothetical protein O2U62_06775 [Candidatus Bathyarchaeota archaeon]|nr:hypothetical protein [Candidatus Bathyarchaeota archaeon]
MAKKVFLITDEVEERTVAYYEAPNFGIVVRNNYKMFEKINPNYQTDWKVFEVGVYAKGAVIPLFYTDDKYIIHHWNEFNFPEEVVQKMNDSEQKKLQAQPPVVGEVPPDFKGM